MEAHPPAHLLEVLHPNATRRQARLRWEFPDLPALPVRLPGQPRARLVSSPGRHGISSRPQ
eukprot:2885001-Prorocentrum_lima.AAC.1